MKRKTNANLGARARGYSARNVDRDEPFERILIVCEGARTEPLYFQSFPVTSARVDVIGLGMNTLSIVKAAILRRNRARAEGIVFDQVWAVFDRDSFPPKRINTALALAHKEGIRVAFSNEAFELWLLLHFDYCDSALSRTQYGDMLSARLPVRYRKNDPNLYHYLLPHIGRAFKHADKLAARRPAGKNPSTTVHLLVRELLSLMTRQGREPAS